MNRTNGSVLERPKVWLIRRMFTSLDRPSDIELAVCGVEACLEPTEVVEPVGTIYWTPSCQGHRLYDPPENVAT